MSSSSSHSNFEWTGSNNESYTTTSTETDPWLVRMLGENWFNYNVYKVVVQRPIYRRRHIDIKKVCDQVAENFSYICAYDMLQRQVDRVFGTDLREQYAEGREAYLMAVGLIEHKGSDAARRVAMASLKCGMDSISGSDSPPPSYVPKGVPQRSSPSTYSSCSSDGEKRRHTAQDLAQRSKALNEFCQRRGLSLLYSSPLKLSFDPPLCTVKVMVGKESWTGRATNQRAARLDAAYRASVALGIHVPADYF